MADSEKPAKKPDDDAPVEETKRQRFVRLATKRVQNAEVSINRLKTLANPASYEYTDNDIKAIEQALFDRVHDAIEALREETPGEAGFSLEA